jgi:hypothetical protein
MQSMGSTDDRWCNTAFFTEMCFPTMSLRLALMRTTRACMDKLHRLSQYRIKNSPAYTPSTVCEREVCIFHRLLIVLWVSPADYRHSVVSPTEHIRVAERARCIAWLSRASARGMRVCTGISVKGSAYCSSLARLAENSRPDPTAWTLQRFGKARATDKGEV